MPAESDLIDPAYPSSPPDPPYPISPSRVWVDGCFDFTHHGHSGVLLQSKLLAAEIASSTPVPAGSSAAQPPILVVGLHSDASITSHKGPPVMSLPERLLSVAANRWSDLSVPNAPYVTSPTWMDAYGCQYVVHGDDLTTDAEGNDCYAYVKEVGRFKVVKRTPGISTTDLVGRMLVCTRTHHLHHSITAVPAEEVERIRAYASDENGVRGAGPELYEIPMAGGEWTQIVAGKKRTEKQPLVYIDGGFDLFTPGHIRFLQLVQAEYEGGEKPFVVAGCHTDAVINRHKGLNYPIMNLLERVLLLLQCRYIDAVVINAPYAPDAAFLDQVGEKFGGKVEAVWHGPTEVIPIDEDDAAVTGPEMQPEADPYSEAKRRCIYKETGHHEYEDVTPGSIVQRILKKRELYEERQRKKGYKMENFGG